MRARISDVAKMVGVSTATVSYVLNGTKHVSDQTREKVLAAVETLQYSPNTTARMLKTGKKNNIGFIVPDISNLFFPFLIEKAEEIMTRNGYNLIVTNTRESIELEQKAIINLSSGIVDGLLIASTAQQAQQIAPLLRQDVPAVFLDRRVPGCEADTVTVSAYSSICEGLEKMIDAGHRKIGLIVGPAKLSTSLERERAYRDTLAKRGLPVDESLIKFVKGSYHSSEGAARQLVEAGCDGIFAGSGLITYDILRELRWRVWDEDKIAVLGFQDSPRDCDLSIRGAFVIEQPTLELCHFAVERILERIQNPKLRPKDMVLYSVYRGRGEFL